MCKERHNYSLIWPKVELYSLVDIYAVDTAMGAVKIADEVEGFVGLNLRGY